MVGERAGQTSSGLRGRAGEAFSCSAALAVGAWWSAAIETASNAHATRTTTRFFFTWCFLLEFDETHLLTKKGKKVWGYGREGAPCDGNNYLLSSGCQANIFLQIGLTHREMGVFVHDSEQLHSYQVLSKER